jgi:predicted phosphoadenosine phosphosulfate sulfurtransferase
MEEVGEKQHLWLHRVPQEVLIFLNLVFLMCSHKMNNENFYHLFAKAKHL